MNNMQKIRIRFLLIFVLSISLFQKCKPQTEIPSSLDGMLLCIEDLDGIGGSSSGNFSDIVAYDPISNKQYILTSDVYYDDYPTYSSKTKKVYFESKRENYHPAVGLTATSHIYMLDLLTKKISLLDDMNLRKIFSLKNWEELETPVISHQGNILLFQYNWGDYKNNYDRLILLNIQNYSYEYLFDSLSFSFRYVFSENDSDIVFDSQTNAKLKNRTKYIGLLNITTKKKKILVIEKNIENELGDYKFNKIVFTSKKWNQEPNQASLFIYNISTDKKHRIASVSELGFREIKYPVFKDETSIYFIGSKDSPNPDTFDEDIYLLNIKTKEMKQITFTHNIKDNLRYYK